MNTVYLPTAVIGNGRILATVGGAGELMTFFYPHLDYAQNVHEGLLGIHTHEHGFSWTFEPMWERRQRYLNHSNILRTELLNRKAGIHLTVTDIILPNESALVRQIEIKRTSAVGSISVYQYFDLWLGGHRWCNSVQALLNDRVIVQWFRDFWMAVGGTPFDEYQCGKSDAGMWSNAKDDLYDGSLRGQQLEIGAVNFAIGWRLPLGQLHRTITFAIVAADTQARVLQLLRKHRHSSVHDLVKRTHRHWGQWLASVTVPDVEDELKEAYMRAALTLPLLFDEQLGAPIAAPEFDPAFVASGGYGFCWLRDATEMMHIWLKERRRQQIRSFITWVARTQMEDGSWLQRYWLNGELGPAWSTGEFNIQWDQTASVIIWAVRCYRELHSLVENANDAQRLTRVLWRMVRRAADCLSERITVALSKSEMPLLGMDLWETFRGSFVYTNAAAYRALLDAAWFAQERRQRRRSELWRETAHLIKAYTLEHMRSNGAFTRGLSENGTRDEIIDSSALGAIVPFGMLDLDDVAEREIAIQTVRCILDKITVPTAHGTAVLRYEGDKYAGNMACTMSTLWMARVHFRFMQWCAKRGAQAEAMKWFENALPFLNAGIHGTTPVGIPCELFKPDGTAYWAPGHAWACAWVIKAIDEFARAKQLCDAEGNA